jgi:NAD(P)-dependent dehydrogenase (short-subunit alcohol dehydrogenase family)
MSSGSAIASISSTGGLGWSRRIPVLMDLLKVESYASIVEWCEKHPEHVGEGYAFSKEAIIVWTMLSSNSLIKQGIRINCILPGPTQTPMMAQLESISGRAVMEAAMQPINRFSTPGEQAGPLVFLNSDIASYVNGVVLPVDGGFMGGIATGQIDLRAMMKNAS